MRPLLFILSHIPQPSISNPNVFSITLERSFNTSSSLSNPFLQLEASVESSLSRQKRDAESIKGLEKELAEANNAIAALKKQMLVIDNTPDTPHVVLPS